MAQQDDRQQPRQPAEDFYGRPTGPRGEEEDRDTRRKDDDARPEPARKDDDSREAPRRQARNAQDEGCPPEEHCHLVDPWARAPGAILDDIPDGDGPRSDVGTNPLPDVYWEAYPDGNPGERH